MTRRLALRRDWVAALGSSQGAVLVEFTLVFPLMLLLALNAINFSTYIYSWITVSNAARDAAEFQTYNGVPVGASSIYPAYSDVNTLVTADLASLPPTSNTWTLEVCSSFNGTTSCAGTGSYTPPADPEPSIYTLYSIDIAYTYAPLVSAFTLPVLNISMTIPPTTIHQQIVMRSLQ